MVGHDLKVGNVVVGVLNAFHGRLIHAIFYEGVSERRAAQDRLSHDNVPPRVGHAIGTNADFSTVKLHRTIVAALNIVFTRPHQFYGRTHEALRNRSTLTLDMGIGRSTPA